MRVLRNKIEISDILRYAFFAENETYGWNKYIKKNSRPEHLNIVL